MVELVYRKDIDYNLNYSLRDELNNPNRIESIKEYLWKKNIYNNRNLIEKNEFFNSKEAVVGNQKFEYDDKNRMIKDIFTHDDYENIIVTSYEYIEDKTSGNKTEIKTEKIGEQFNQKEIIVKDSNGEIINNELHDSYGLVFKFENIYNGKHLIKTLEYGNEGKLIFETEYETDSIGNITKAISKDGKIINIELNTYDLNNCLVESRLYKNDVEFAVKKYEFNKDHKLIKEENYLNGELNFERSYKYDINGNIIEIFTNSIRIDLRRKRRSSDCSKAEKIFDNNNNVMEELFLENTNMKNANLCLKYIRK